MRYPKKRGGAFHVSFKTQVVDPAMLVIYFPNSLEEVAIQAFSLMSQDWVLPAYQTVVFDLGETQAVSDKMYRSLATFSQQLKKNGQSLFSVGMNEALKRQFQSDGVIDIFNPRASLEAIKEHVLKGASVAKSNATRENKRVATFPLNTNILVVDDMATMRNLLVKSLKELGFSNVQEAVNGADAYQKLTASEQPVGLIISESNMPQTTGLDLLKRLRAEAKFSKIPFIMVTADADKKKIVEAVMAGVSSFVIKPFTTDTLREKLEAVATQLKL